MNVFVKVVEAAFRYLRGYEPTPLPIHIVHREGRLTSARVRTFIDFIAEQLRNDNMLNSLR